MSAHVVFHRGELEERWTKLGCHKLSYSCVISTQIIAAQYRSDKAVHYLNTTCIYNDASTCERLIKLII